MFPMFAYSLCTGLTHQLLLSSNLRGLNEATVVLGTENYSLTIYKNNLQNQNKQKTIFCPHC